MHNDMVAPFVTGSQCTGAQILCGVAGRAERSADGSGRFDVGDSLRGRAGHGTGGGNVTGGFSVRVEAAERSSMPAY